MAAYSLDWNAEGLDPPLEHYPLFPGDGLGWRSVQGNARCSDGYLKTMGASRSAGNAESQVNVHFSQYGDAAAGWLRRQGDFHQVNNPFEGQLVPGTLFGVPAKDSVFEVLSGTIASQLGFPLV